MAIDINKDVKLFGNLGQLELIIVTLALVACFIVGVALIFGIALSVGLTWLSLSLGAVGWFATYQAGLPKGYLSRRWSHEGKFLFFRVPGRSEPDVYVPESFRRQAQFQQHLQEVPRA